MSPFDGLSEPDNTIQELDSGSEEEPVYDLEDFNHPWLRPSPGSHQAPFSQPKNPFTAGMLSLLLMGGGQFYNGEALKGTVFFVSDLLFKSSIIVSLIFISNQYPLADGESLSFIDLEGKHKVALFTLLSSYFGLLVFNVWDATSSAHRFNKKYFMVPSLNLVQIDQGIWKPEMAYQLTWRF